MTDEELKERFDEIQAAFEVIAKAIADQQTLTIRMMAHQQAHLAAIRNLMVRMGDDRTTLGQQLRSAYQTAVTQYHDQLEAYQKSGDVIAFVNSLVFPDETLGN